MSFMPQLVFLAVVLFLSYDIIGTAYTIGSKRLDKKASSKDIYIEEQYDSSVYTKSKEEEQKRNSRMLSSSTELPSEMKNLNSYHVTDESTNDEKLIYQLRYQGGASDKIRNSQIIQNLELSIVAYDKKSLQFKIVPKDDPKRWQIPEEDPYPRFRNKDKKVPLQESCCAVTVNHQPFSIKVIRKDNNEVLFDSTGEKLVFTDTFMWIKSKIASNSVYGFGERNYDFKLQDGIYTIWGRDEPGVIEQGQGGGNVYGHHPVGLVRDSQSKHSLTYLRNVNAKDVVVKGASLEYRVVGGVFDFNFFVGDSPDSVLELYHNYCGNWTMMPFWSMGNQQSRWGYRNIYRVKEIVNKFEEYDIPLDVMWNDLDYMNDKEDFTIDKNAFPPLELTKFLREKKKRWVPLIDAGIRIEHPKGRGASEGKKRGIFLKNYQGKLMVGRVWPGNVHYPDFFHPEAEQYWIDMLEDFWKQIQFSGIWLDMNELASFVMGEESRYGKQAYTDIPYAPGRRDLVTKTISLDAVHYGGIQEYDVHELFNILQNKATYKFLKQKHQLPFILTRSSSPGTGQFSAHWTGDVSSRWIFLKWHISGNFAFQIFGMPFVGADVCGFFESTTAELCARWYQLGSFSPFMRNHNVDTGIDQEPWAFYEKNKNDAKARATLDSAQKSVKLRYSILKWYYSLFLDRRGVGSIFRPLSFEFYNENSLFNENAKYNEDQFLLGSGFMVTPGVEQGKTTRSVYFPVAEWFDIQRGSFIIGTSSISRILTIDVPLNGVAPIFIRGGTTILTQDTQHVKGTPDLTDEFRIIAAMEQISDTKFISSGKILGVKSLEDEVIKTKCMDAANCLYNISVETVEFNKQFISTFKFASQDPNAKLEPLAIDSIKIYGLPTEILDEDEFKYAYALTQLFDGNLKSKSSPETYKATRLAAGSYLITFPKIINVEAGDVIKVQLVF